MKLTVVQHVPFEQPGLIARWTEKYHHELAIIKVFDQQPFPSADEVEFLVVLGGPMSVKDSDKWLLEERQLIKQIVDQTKPMLGICLGAQQLAYAFGSTIQSTPKEVGWGEIHAEQAALDQLEAKQTYRVLHWHGEGFSLPQGAVPLFSSSAWQNQGFLYKQAIGLQFHLETTPRTLQPLVQQDKEFLQTGLFKQSPEHVLAEKVPQDNQQLLFTILNKLSAELH